MLVTLCGIILPTLALAVESNGHICRDAFFDPIPNLFAVCQVAMVPLVMGPLLVGVRGAIIEFCLGMVLVICIGYAVLFGPIVPQSLFAIILGGIGLLGLSPLLAALTSIWLVFRVGPSITMLVGVASAVLLNSLNLWRSERTLHWAQISDVTSLRRWGDLGILESEACKDPKIALLYWRVTGQELPLHEPRPVLELKSSRWDGSINAEAGFAYAEWTAELYNPGSLEQEGRFQFNLPPGVVASRATLWVHGTEREAAFAAAGQAQAAYEAVTARNQDPLLVTQPTQNCLEVRCFPVPPQGKMKFRLGFTCRLQPNPHNQTLNLPEIQKHNLKTGIKSMVWLEGDQPLETPGQPPAKILRGDWANFPTITAPSPNTQFCCRLHDGKWLQATLKPLDPPKNWALVLDSGQAMAAYRKQLGELPNLPCIIPTDHGPELLPPGRIPKFEGGQDNPRALSLALETHPVVVWVHAAQPLDCGSAERLKQTLERGHGKILELALEPSRLDIPSQPLNSLQLPTQQWEYRLFQERPSGIPTSDHLARLWAAQSDSLKLALEYQLVTRRTGAVVLENQQQYKDAGLQPVDPGSVPTIPEPGALALLAVGALISKRRRR